MSETFKTMLLALAIIALAIATTRCEPTPLAGKLDQQIDLGFGMQNI